jgi:hypothetical protein
MYFHKNNPVNAFKAVTKNQLHLQIIKCKPKEITWEQSSPDNSFMTTYSVNQLLPGRTYSIYGDGVLLKKIKSDAKGNLIFNQSINTKKLEIVL